MKIPCKSVFSFFCVALFCVLPVLLFARAAEQTHLKFDFGIATAAKGYQKVTAADVGASLQNLKCSNVKPAGN